MVAFGVVYQREDAPIVLHLRDGAVVTTHRSTLEGTCPPLAKRAADGRDGHIHLPDMDSYSMMVVMNFLRGQKPVGSLLANGSGDHKERVLKFAREYQLRELEDLIAPSKPRSSGLGAPNAQSFSARPHPVHVLESIRRHTS